MKRRIAPLLTAAAALLPTGSPRAATPGPVEQQAVEARTAQRPGWRTREWRQWGGSPRRNNAPRGFGIPIDWNVETGRNILWSVPLGSETNSTPVVAGGHVYVGTNNGRGYLARYPAEVDLGCLLCFDAATGGFLWQYSAEKLPTGRPHDWPHMGICSSPRVKSERLWLVSNRGELVCLDTEGFRDGENDGPYRREVVVADEEADVVWSLDMMNELGVQQHNMANCSVTGANGVLFVATANGVEKSHESIPAPHAPSFLAVDERTGDILWSDNSPGVNILHGQWSSPAFAVLRGLPQVIFAGGDGWLYSFSARGDGSGGARLLWKFDCNPKESVWQINGTGTRNNIIASPVVHDGLVYVATGLDPEKPAGRGDLWCVDPARHTDGRDVSPELAIDPDGNPLPQRRVQAVIAEQNEQAVANPDSALVWHYAGCNRDGNQKVAFHECLHHTLCSVAIHNNLLILPDLAGVVHCLDARTGEMHWTCDLLDEVWASPLIVDGKVYVATVSGSVAIFRLHANPDVAMNHGEPIAAVETGHCIHATPIVADNVMYVATSRRLFAIGAIADERPSH
jgi:outer membrane protein assembly factor BamB